MIVSCPACSAHYSHAAVGVLQMGRCSQCDARFPLSGQKRRYIVKPAVRSGSPDPLLAAGLAETQTRVDVQAETVAFPTRSKSMQDADFPPLPEEIVSESGAAEDDGFFGIGTDDDEAFLGTDEPSTGPPTDTEPADRRPIPPVREALGVFLLAGLGGAAGFHGSLQFGFEPLKAVAVGLVVGLTLGWAWIRWAERKH